MNEKKYLKWYHKVGYGAGDIAGNCVYAMLTAFRDRRKFCVIDVI